MFVFDSSARTDREGGSTSVMSHTETRKIILLSCRIILETKQVCKYETNKTQVHV